MIIDIRGTNGSGKSYVPRRLVEALPSNVTVVCGVPVTVCCDVHLIGRYHNVCGGADGVHNQTALSSAIWALRNNTVIVEGSIVACVFDRWNRIAAQIPDYQFWFLDTPLELCIERVKARRAAAGTVKEFDQYKTLIPRHEAILRVRAKLEAAGRTCVTLNHLNPYDQVANAIGLPRI